MGENIYILVSAIISFGVTALLGFLAIPLLHKLKFGQTILDIGPVWHREKQGTATMGGVMFIIGTIFAFFVSLGAKAVFLKDSAGFFGADGLMNTRIFGGLIMAFAFGLIGFVDDYIKVVKKQNEGLTAKQKTVLQAVVTLGYLVSLMLAGDFTTYIPFIGTVDTSLHSVFGYFYWPISFIAIYGFVNAVNLTDGIDGLASSVTAISGIAYIACALCAGGIAGVGDLNILSAALVGGCLGFLVWNAHPAKVFMGDTGSMFLGGMVTAIAFGLNRPYLLFLVGILYLIEAFSVVIQVAYYKKTKKRLFKMSPIHHHYEMSGWSEYKIVFVFSLVAAIGGLIGVATVIWG
jgi:phospho-N-acetylmuramoyl-pentapeptide-transferase